MIKPNRKPDYIYNIGHDNIESFWFDEMIAEHTYYPMADGIIKLRRIVFDQNNERIICDAGIYLPIIQEAYVNWKNKVADEILLN